MRVNISKTVPGCFPRCPATGQGAMAISKTQEVPPQNEG